VEPEKIITLQDITALSLEISEKINEILTAIKNVGERDQGDEERTIYAWHRILQWATMMELDFFTTLLNQGITLGSIEKFVEVKEDLGRCYIREDNGDDQKFGTAYLLKLRGLQERTGHLRQIDQKLAMQEGILPAQADEPGPTESPR